MGKVQQQLRENIAANIRAERMKRFPGRGGAKQCAEALNVSPQQLSQWERAIRTPDETRLEKLASFFQKTVEYMRRDHRPPVLGAPPRQHSEEPPPYAAMSMPELLVAMGRDQVKAVYQVELAVTGVRFVRRGGNAL